jgi:predicted DNA repair protein MutK
MVAPKFMHLVSVVGTAAMFLVGGGILVHGWPLLHHAFEGLTQGMGFVPGMLTPWLFDVVIGLAAGALALAAMLGLRRLRQSIGLREG